MRREKFAPERIGLSDRLPFGLRSDAFCTVAWIVDPYEAVMVFADPVLIDRAQEICEEMNAMTTTHRDLDSLVAAVNRWAAAAGLSASIYDEPRDDVSTGVVAVSFEVG